jgi:hypothetical protein
LKTGNEDRTSLGSFGEAGEGEDEWEWFIAVWLFARTRLDEAEALINPTTPVANESNSQPPQR